MKLVQNLDKQLSLNWLNDQILKFESLKLVEKSFQVDLV